MGSICHWPGRGDRGIRNEADARLLEEQQPAKAEPPGTTLLEPDDAAAPPLKTSALEQADFATSRRVEAIDDRLEAIDTTIGSWGRPDLASLQSIFPRLPDPTITKSPASSSRVVRVQDCAELFPTLEAEPSRLDESQVGSVATLVALSALATSARANLLKRSRFLVGAGSRGTRRPARWDDEKLALHTLHVHPDSVACRPPLKKGGQGGVSPRNHSLVRVFPDGSPPRICRIGPTYWLCLLTPPAPPSQGGDVPMTRNKNTHLESTASFHRDENESGSIFATPKKASPYVKNNSSPGWMGRRCPEIHLLTLDDFLHVRVP